MASGNRMKEAVLETSRRKGVQDRCEARKATEWVKIAGADSYYEAVADT